MGVLYECYVCIYLGYVCFIIIEFILKCKSYI